MWISVLPLCMFVYHICTCCCLRPEESRFPQNWSYRRLWAPMIFWELNGGSSGRAAHILNCQATFPACMNILPNRGHVFTRFHKDLAWLIVLYMGLAWQPATADWYFLCLEESRLWLVFRSLDLFLVTLPLAVLYQKYLSLLCSKVN